MANLIVNEDVKLKLKTGAGTVTVDPLTSVMVDNVKINGKKIFNIIGFNVTGASLGTISSATGKGVIVGNSKDVKGNLLPVVLDNAESPPLPFTGTNSSPPPPTAPFTDIVIIENAGQSVVHGS